MKFRSGGSMMVAATLAWGNQTLADLEKVEGKAELIAGRIVRHMSAGFRHNRVAANIYRSLHSYESTTGVGAAVTDNVGFGMKYSLASGRQSFSPDAAYSAVFPTETGIVEGPPAFAVEVRSDNDYGAVAESEMAEKRADYFEAGTLVVWDVDWKRSETVAVYRSSDPENPRVYSRGEIAEAEPALPGWRMSVDDVFAP